MHCLLKEQECRNCIFCHRKKRVNSGKELKPGDHIFYKRTVYEHHAIIIEKKGNSFKLIEATNSAKGASVDISSGGGKAKIKESSVQFDFQRERIFVIRYKERFSKTETIRRARKALSSREWSEDYRYHILRNNCEHFARYCATGERISIQVALYQTLLSYSLREREISDLLDPAEKNERYMFELLKKYHLICDNCFRLSRDVKEVSVMRIMKEEDVQRGDVFCYHPFQDKVHYAVILEVHRSSNLEVLCTIMHYAAFSGGKKGTIKKDEITIKLNGEYLKLDYTSKYNVYTPDVVIRRAKRWENEQLHERDFNDSRCFVRWCKIKEPKIKEDTVLLDINPCAVL